RRDLPLDDLFQAGAAGVRQYLRALDELDERTGTAAGPGADGIESSALLLCPGRLGDAEPTAELLEAFQRRPLPLAAHEGLRQRHVADMQRRGITTGRDGAYTKVTRQPARRVSLWCRPRRVPDCHRLEVRAIRVRIADALHDSELSLVEQMGEGGQR